MTETLWVSLPSQEKNALNEVLDSISSKNLTNLSINQLIKKLENNQASGWLEVLSEYNSIPSILNMDTSEMLVRAKGVRNKFGQRRYPQLKDKEFEPRELLGLVILCYSNPNLIGPNLCRALNDNDADNIKKEILENSARVKDRVAPWASNLRLANYALYANDTSIKLPVNTMNRVKDESIQRGRTVIIKDFQDGFEEVVNGLERASRMKRVTGSEIDSQAPLFQNLQSASEEDDFSESKSSYEVRGLPWFFANSKVNRSGNVYSPPLIREECSAASHVASESHLSDILASGWILFHVANQIPVVAPVMRNACKDVKNAISFMSSVLLKNKIEHSDQVEERAPQLSPAANFKL